MGASLSKDREGGRKGRRGGEREEGEDCMCVWLERETNKLLVWHVCLVVCVCDILVVV